jgi:hypothetical protein
MSLPATQLALESFSTIGVVVPAMTTSMSSKRAPAVATTARKIATSPCGSVCCRVLSTTELLMLLVVHELTIQFRYRNGFDMCSHDKDYRIKITI